MSLTQPSARSILTYRSPSIHCLSFSSRAPPEREDRSFLPVSSTTDQDNESPSSSPSFRGRYIGRQKGCSLADTTFTGSMNLFQGRPFRSLISLWISSTEPTFTCMALRIAFFVSKDVTWLVPKTSQ